MKSLVSGQMKSQMKSQIKSQVNRWSIHSLLIGGVALLLSLTPSAYFDGQSDLSASTEMVEFSQPELRQRYYSLIAELRCPKCQNQNLADSNAPISTDMKAQVHRMLEQQKSDAEIKAYLVSRYSEFVLYRPSVNQKTLFLWVSPAVLLLITLLILYRHFYLRGMADNPDTQSSQTQLNQDQQRRLSKLLKAANDKTSKDQQSSGDNKL